MIDERTRREVQRLCAHVISRERHARTGRIGLVVSGGRIGTDALGLGRDGLVRISDGARRVPATLQDAADLAGVDLHRPFSVGHETPPLGDPTAPLEIDPAALAELLVFFDRAWTLLGAVTDGAPLTLWPEHFDTAFVWRDAANVGASPGDDQSPAPYVYVGPWTPEWPGDPTLWNAPFGASIGADAPDEAILEFIRVRLGLLAAGGPS